MLRPVAAGVAVLAVGVSAGAAAWATLGSELAPWRDPRPSVAVEQAEGAFATRALFVTPGERGAGYRFVGREGSTLVRPLPSVAKADGAVADRVSAVLGDPAAGPELFLDTATDLLAVRSGIAPEVATRLDATAGLQRVSPRLGWEMWRVSPAAVEDGDSLVAPPRLRLETPTGDRLVETTGEHAATSTSLDVPAGSRLVVAEPLGWAEHATVTVDGEVVAPVAGGDSPDVRAARRDRTPHHHRRRPGALVARRPARRGRGAGLPRRPVRAPRVAGGHPMTRPVLARSGAALRSVNWAGVARVVLVGASVAAVVQVASTQSVGLDLAAAVGDDDTPVTSTALTTRVSQVCPGAELSGIAGLPDVAVPATVTAVTGPAELLPAAAPAGGSLVVSVHDEEVLSIDGRPRSGTETLPQKGPVRVSADAGLAPAVAAAQEWRLDTKELRGLASAPCGPGSTDQWLLAGGAGPGRQERLVLSNPGANPVTAAVAVHGGAGPLGEPMVQTVPPGGRVKPPPRRAHRRPRRRRPST